MPRQRPLILASGSRWRRELLDKLRIPYHWMSPDIDETRRPNELPQAMVKRLSLAKAERVAIDHSDHLIIGSDQVALHKGHILGKPGDTTSACEQLARFSGQRIRFITGLALIDTSNGLKQVCHEHYDVVFRQLSCAEIKRYIALEQPLDCAGSFRMEGLGISLFERLEGNDPNTLIGLPLIRLCAMLRDAGMNPLE